jgi:hypothetical protein
MKTQTVNKNVRELAAVATRCSRIGPGGGKAEFHQYGRRVLKHILSLLGVEGEVRSNKGGPAVVGEVILHTDRVYVRLCTSLSIDKPQFCYRSCQGMKDYSGGGNRWYTFEQLAADPDAFVRTLRELA